MKYSIAFFIAVVGLINAKPLSREECEDLLSKPTTDPSTKPTRQTLKERLQEELKREACKLAKMENGRSQFANIPSTKNNFVDIIDSVGGTSEGTVPQIPNIPMTIPFELPKLPVPEVGSSESLSKPNQVEVNIYMNGKVGRSDSLSTSNQPGSASNSVVVNINLGEEVSRDRPTGIVDAIEKAAATIIDVGKVVENQI